MAYFLQEFTNYTKNVAVGLLGHFNGVEEKKKQHQM